MLITDLTSFINYLFYSKIVDKIDKNHDKFVSENELRNWIRYQHKLDLQKDGEKKWNKINSNKDEHLTFDELIDNTIGKMETCISNKNKSCLF